MKNVNDYVLVCVIILFAVALLAVRANAQSYEYKGVYAVESVLLNYCEDCYLQLPPDFLHSEIVLSIKTNEETTLFKALQTSSQAIGWDLTRTKKGMLKAEPIENAGNLIYISCMDKQPRNVPKYLYSASIEADRIQCLERDSLQAIYRARQVRDSIYKDSLKNVPALDFTSYELKYFAYSKSFTDKIGVEWQTLLSSGNLRNRFDLFDDWRIVAQQSNDTTFTERSVEFSVDSLLSIDWGSEEQTLKQTYVNDGVTTQDYEWRKYGLIVKVRRDGKRVRMDYIFRDKDNSISVLQGSVIGVEGDTLRLFGHYNTNRRVENGVPFLSSIPLLGNLFKVENTMLDSRAFELYLLPQKKAVKDEKRNKPEH